MTLLGTIGLSSNALTVASLGLQVTGNNIANANTPGYIRQRLVQKAGPVYPYGGLLLGTGVQVEGIVQVFDKFLAQRLRDATSDVAGAEAQADAYAGLESILNELGDSDLSTSLTSFFGSIHDVLNQPESVSIRNIALQEGQALADSIRRLDGQVRDLHQDINTKIVGMGSEINDLLNEVARLNIQIVDAEGGSVSPSDAVGLRDRREQILGKLAEITDIRTVEQPTGDVTVFSGGDYLVSLGDVREVNVVTNVVDGLQVSEIRIAALDAPITSGGGRLGGLLEARDNVVGGFLSDLDHFTRTLIGEFNKIHAGGQGLTGYSSLTGENAVSDPAAVLDDAGLDFTPVNGAFQVQLVNSQTLHTETYDIRVDLNGLAADTSLADIAAQIDAIDGLSATITADRKLNITADSPELRFAFANDTSGVLGALGLNTFFTGSRASDIGINQTLRADPGKLAMSAGGIAEDTENGKLLANLLTTPLAAHGDLSLAALYDRMTNNVAQSAQTAGAAADGFKSFQQALEGQFLAVTTVNLDEEAVKMILYQRAFQASAKVISTCNELLETLLTM
jgi:flagellar hook-associated protein 1